MNQFNDIYPGQCARQVSPAATRRSVCDTAFKHNRLEEWFMTTYHTTIQLGTSYGDYFKRSHRGPERCTTSTGCPPTDVARLTARPRRTLPRQRGLRLLEALPAETTSSAATSRQLLEMRDGPCRPSPARSTTTAERCGSRMPGPRLWFNTSIPMIEYEPVFMQFNRKPTVRSNRSGGATHRHGFERLA